MEDEDYIDLEVDDEGRAQEPEEVDFIDKVGAWIKAHKVLTVFAIILFPITFIILGGLAFSTHSVVETQVEVPKPSCTDGYKKVPTHTETTTYYEWVPEDSYEE